MKYSHNTKFGIKIKIKDNNFYEIIKKILVKYYRFLINISPKLIMLNIIINMFFYAFVNCLFFIWYMTFSN